MSTISLQNSCAIRAVEVEGSAEGEAGTGGTKKISGDQWKKLSE